MFTKILIGIQARSTSQRLPNKIGASLGNKTVLQHVIEACFGASLYLNNWNTKKMMVDVALLFPYDDVAIKRLSDEIQIVEGPEEDVLTRYGIALQKFPSDYICRITADCPFIPQYLISKIITIAVSNSYDYVSNVDERCRTSPDGWDCEVLSKRALEFLMQSARNISDREHVTPYIRRSSPNWIKQGFVIGHIDLSPERLKREPFPTKLSVDTEEDLEKVRREAEMVEAKYDLATEIFGRQHVHRV